MRCKAEIRDGDKVLILRFIIRAEIVFIVIHKYYLLSAKENEEI